MGILSLSNHSHQVYKPSGSIFINTALQKCMSLIICLSQCYVFPLLRWDGSCQSAPVCRTIRSVSFKNLWSFFPLTIVWRRQKHQYPRKQQYHQLQFLSESHFNLKANAKGKSIHPIKAKPFLPAFPKLIHQHLYMFPTEFNQAVHDEATRLLEYLWDMCCQNHECNVLMDEAIQCFFHSSNFCDIMIGENVCKEEVWFDLTRVSLSCRHHQYMCIIS